MPTALTEFSPFGKSGFHPSAWGTVDTPLMLQTEAVCQERRTRLKTTKKETVVDRRDFGRLSLQQEKLSKTKGRTQPLLQALSIFSDLA